MCVRACGSATGGSSGLLCSVFLTEEVSVLNNI